MNDPPSFHDPKKINDGTNCEALIYETSMSLDTSYRLSVSQCLLLSTLKLRSSNA